MYNKSNENRAKGVSGFMKNELRVRGFRNEIFDSLVKVEDQLCFAIQNLLASTVRSITGRQWILDCF